MRITVPTAVIEGTQLTVMPFRADAVIGTMSVPTLVQLVPSPRREEDVKTLKAASGGVRRHAQLRSLVQRALKSTQKGKNVGSYAEYIADGVKGEPGAGWSTPPRRCSQGRASRCTTPRPGPSRRACSAPIS